MRIIVVRVGDIKLYPPTISLMNILCDLGHECICITTGDSAGVEKATSDLLKIEYIDYSYNENKSLLGKAVDRSKICKMLWVVIDKYYNSQSVLWVMSDVTIKHLGYKILNYKYVLHMDELNDGIYYTSKIKKLKLDAKKIGDGAIAVVVPEYNRAHITKAWWGLSKLPYILPNKPYVNEEEVERLGISNQAGGVLKRLENKKIVLYQGGLGKERPIYKFVEAVEELKDYAFVIMSGDYSEYARNNYNNCYFIDFMNPPMHLNITKLAYIGIVAYVPVAGNNSVLNAIYCAPNKIFEYARYRVPIIGNDIPGLRTPIKEFGCGLIVEKMEKTVIQDCILSIERNYSDFSQKSKEMYDAYNNQIIVENILKGI